MKQIIFPLFLVCLMALAVSAQVPQVPYIIYGHVDWNGAPYSSAPVEVTHKGIIHNVVADGNGAYSYQLDSYSSTDVVQIKVTDGCGTSDVCSKSITIGSTMFSELGFSLSGTLTCPPVKCPSCGGGGGGSSCTYTKTKCDALYPVTNEDCTNVWYESGTCPEAEPCFDSCPAQEECEVCETTPIITGDCPECEKPNDALIWIIGGVVSILFAIAGLVLGGYKWFPGMKGLANYYIQEGLKLVAQGKYEEGKKKIEQGLKGLQTTVEKAKSGAYR